MFYLFEYPVESAYIDEHGLIAGERQLLHRSSNLLAVASHIVETRYFKTHGFRGTFKVLLETTGHGSKSIILGQTVYPPGHGPVRLLDLQSGDKSIEVKIHWEDSQFVETIRANTLRLRGVDPTIERTQRVLAGALEPIPSGISPSAIDRERHENERQANAAARKRLSDRLSRLSFHKDFAAVAKRRYFSQLFGTGLFVTIERLRLFWFADANRIVKELADFNREHPPIVGVPNLDAKTLILEQCAHAWILACNAAGARPPDSEGVRVYDDPMFCDPLIQVLTTGHRYLNAKHVRLIEDHIETIHKRAMGYVARARAPKTDDGDAVDRLVNRGLLELRKERKLKR